jgi:penicillin amidase
MEGLRKSEEPPFEFNPARHYIATANHNILPPGYKVPLGYDGWAVPHRITRIREMLDSGRKFDVADFERMQQDVVSLPARRFQETLRKWRPAAGSRAAKVAGELLAWNAELRADSRAALIYEVWNARLGTASSDAALQKSLDAALAEIERRLGPDQKQWHWGKFHQLALTHPLGRPEFSLAPVARPGDGNTVNATSGTNFRQTNGASWRQILDVGNWDRSVMTNVPGESGDPSSRHYSDLLQDWAAGKYHPMPFSRKAVEAAMEERIILLP